MDAPTPRLHATRGLLALALGLMAVLVLGGAVWPVNPDAYVVRWLTVGLVLAALAGLALVLPARPWAMPASVAAGMVCAGVLVASCLTAEGLVVLSLGLITAAQFAAFAFPARDAGLLVALALVAITLGMIAAPAPFHVMTWLVIVVMTLASTALLGYVTHWLRRHATTDDLTGALTRGALLERLSVLLRESQRTGSALAVVSADVDHFKTINDTRGHLAGDEVLASLVATWRSASNGRSRVVGRVGGDEFVVVLPGYDRAAAGAWVARTRGDSAAPWSAGITVATATDTVRDLLDRADVALYAAKHARDPRPLDAPPPGPRPLDPPARTGAAITP